MGGRRKTCKECVQYPGQTMRAHRIALPSETQYKDLPVKPFKQYEGMTECLGTWLANQPTMTAAQLYGRYIGVTE